MFISSLILGNKDLQYRCFLVGPQRDEEKIAMIIPSKKHYTEINFLSDIPKFTDGYYFLKLYIIIHTHIIGHICCLHKTLVP